MSNEFGYIPESPEQSFGNNKGIFTPTDIYDLTRADKYTNYGQLELIETQTHSSDVASIDFTSIQESTYNVHFLTFDDFQTASDNVQEFQIQLYESGVLETASVYQSAFQRGRTDGAFTEYRSTGTGHMYINQNGGNATNEKSCGYVYFYNLGDSSKYSFATQQTIVTQNDSVQNITFGSSVLPQASTVNGIRIKPSSGNYSSFTATLYGIKEY